MSIPGKGGGSKAPAPPDYVAAAKAQGDANLEAIRAGAALNRVNQTGPTGSTTYKNLGGDQWQQTTSLSPNQQSILDALEGNQIDMGQTANQRLSQFSNQAELDTSGQPSRVTNVAPSNFQTNVTSPGTRYQDIDLSRLANFGNANVQGGLDFSGAPGRSDANYQKSVDFSGLPAIPGANDFNGERQKVEDALYSRSTADLDPQYQQREQALRTSLLNSGNTEGSEAWNNAMGNFNRERTGAYDQARNSAILAGGNEQSRMLSDALSARGQTVGERLSQGQFANQAADSSNQYGLNARGQSTAETAAQGNFANTAAGQVNNRADSNRQQQLAELLSQGQFGNQAANQDLQTELSKLGLTNAAESDKFSQGVTNANLNNSSRDAGINEQLTQRSLPLQEFLSLYGNSGGAGYQSPSIPQSGTPAAADIFGATQAGYNGQIDQFNANQARNSQNASGVLNLAQIIAQAYGSSDRRLKRDIERAGELPNGLPTYRFRYLDDDRQRIGVMADEVRERFPDAVSQDSLGFDMVNYIAIDAAHLLETMQ